jgi:hypothetical protein
MFRFLENHHQGGHTTALFKSRLCVRLIDLKSAVV